MKSEYLYVHKAVNKIFLFYNKPTKSMLQSYLDANNPSKSVKKYSSSTKHVVY